MQNKYDANSRLQWNKLFEYSYLPELIQRDNRVDPITGLTKYQADRLQEIRQQQETLKQVYTIPKSSSNSSLSKYGNDNSLQTNSKIKSTLPPLHKNDGPRVSYKEPSSPNMSSPPSSPPRESKSKAKSKKDGKDKPSYRDYTNSMVYSSPEMKLGVRFGDSDRMRFPLDERTESTNRLRRARNGFTFVNLYKDALPPNDILYPILRLQKSSKQTGTKKGRSLAKGEFKVHRKDEKILVNLNDHLILQPSETGSYEKYLSEEESNSSDTDEETGSKTTKKSVSSSNSSRRSSIAPRPSFYKKSKKTKGSEVMTHNPDILLKDLRSSFLKSLDEKQQRLETQLEKRQNMRNEGFSSMDMLLKASAIVGWNTTKIVRPEISHDAANAENNNHSIWFSAWTQAQSDPHLLPSRVALYRVILDFVKGDGGLQTEIEEETLNKIRKLLISGSSADIELFQTLIRENGYLLQENTQLYRMLHFIGCVVGCPEEVVQTNLKRITQWNIRSREMRDRMRKKQREHIEEAEEAELAQLMQEITADDNELTTTINIEHKTSSSPREAMIDKTFHDSDSDDDLGFALEFETESDPLGLKKEPLEYKKEHSSNDSTPQSKSPPVSRPLSRSSSPFTSMNRESTSSRNSLSSRNSSPNRDSFNTSDELDNYDERESNYNNGNNENKINDSVDDNNINNDNNNNNDSDNDNSNTNTVNRSPSESTTTLASGRVSPTRPLSRSASPLSSPLTQSLINNNINNIINNNNNNVTMVRSSSLSLESNSIIPTFKEDPRRRFVRHDSLLKRSISLAPLLGSLNSSTPLLSKSSDQPHTNLFRFSHGSGHSSLQNSIPSTPTSKHVHFSDDLNNSNNANTLPSVPSPLSTQNIVHDGDDS